jgi:uncharacterized protein YqgV (UPF0045/DUF77 family)
MHIAVEISLYPLDAAFAVPIHAFIDRLNADPRLKVVTNSMSTQVFGAYEEVMGALTRELRVSLEGERKSVFVMKVVGPLAPA